MLYKFPVNAELVKAEKNNLNKVPLFCCSCWSLNICRTHVEVHVFVIATD